jgi:hypothetical protein
MTVSKSGSNDKNHAEAKHTKGRILRAKDIIPGVPKSKPEKTKQATDIPKFDLAEEILAEQRKTTAIRRKAPGRQRETESTGYATKWSKPALFEQEQIIAEIVARDIEKLRDGNIIY